MALAEATRELYRRIEQDYHPGSVASMNPGSLEDWPIDQQTYLFRILGDPKQDIGVELTDSYLMVPIKSASGILFPDSKGFENCRMCWQGKIVRAEGRHTIRHLVESYKK